MQRSVPIGVKLSKACVRCKALKVACQPDPEDPNQACRKCLKNNHQCIREPYGRRNVSRRSDARLAAPEKEISSSKKTASIAAKLDHHSENSAENDPRPQLTPGPSPRYPGFLNGTMSPVPDDLRLIYGNVLEVRIACKMFDFFREKMAERSSFVTFSPSIPAEEIQRDRPLLFLSILSIAAGVLEPKVHHYLTSEVWKILATRVLYVGTPSLEVLQSLILMATFYVHHEWRSDHANFHQLVHCAATMAMDFGMGRRARPDRSQLYRNAWEEGGGEQDVSKSREFRRAWLGVYYLSSTIATTLRRPHLLRWNAYTQECIDCLRSASDPSNPDQWLCHMVLAEKIGEEVHARFKMDDPMASISLADPQVEFYMKLYEEEIQAWRSQVSSDMPPGLVELTEAHTTLYIHEIAMHEDHDIDNLKPPFALSLGSEPLSVNKVMKLSTQHVLHLTICLSAIHRIFDAFLSIEPLQLRTYPCHVFVRILYAGIAFIKIAHMVTEPGGVLKELLKISDLHIEDYFARLVAQLAETSNRGSYRYTSEFWEQICLMSAWWKRRKIQVQLDTPPTTIIQADEASKSAEASPAHPQDSSSEPPLLDNPPSANLSMFPMSDTMATTLDVFDLSEQFQDQNGNLWADWDLDPIFQLTDETLWGSS